MNKNSNKITLGFQTKGTWTTNDLTLLSTSIGNIYDVFLSKNIYQKAQDSYLENLDFYSNEHERLQIYRIRISSPGGFSFQGIGEILKEIREMVKDLWYRNKQEKAKGELEIIND